MSTIPKEIDQDDVALYEGSIGYSIHVAGAQVGFIEGYPGRMENVVVKPPWRGKGIARAALDAFSSLSREHGASELTTNNVMHPAMEHILKTEDFEKQSDGNEWVKEI